MANDNNEEHTKQDDTFLLQELRRVGADHSAHSFGHRSILEDPNRASQEEREA